MPKYEMTFRFAAETDEDAQAYAHLCQPAENGLLVKLTREDTYMREIPLDSRKDG